MARKRHWKHDRVKSQRLWVLEAVQGGAQTVIDVAAVLPARITQRNISAHLSKLVQLGEIERVKRYAKKYAVHSNGGWCHVYRPKVSAAAEVM